MAYLAARAIRGGLMAVGLVLALAGCSTVENVASPNVTDAPVGAGVGGRPRGGRADRGRIMLYKHAPPHPRQGRGVRHAERVAIIAQGARGQGVVGGEHGQQEAGGGGECARRHQAGHPLPRSRPPLPPSPLPR